LLLASLDLLSKIQSNFNQLNIQEFPMHPPKILAIGLLSFALSITGAAMQSNATQVQSNLIEDQLKPSKPLANFQHKFSKKIANTNQSFLGKWKLEGADDPNSHPQVRNDYIEISQEQGRLKVILSRPTIGDPYELQANISGSDILIPSFRGADCGPGYCSAKFTVSSDGKTAELMITALPAGIENSLILRDLQKFSWGIYNLAQQPSATRKTDEQAQRELEDLRRQGQREGWTFEIGDSLAFRILLSILAGTKVPQNFNPPIAPVEPVGTIPAQFDARQWNVVPPIRNQGDCGSCWAFAAVSSYEIAYNSLYRTPSSINRSEQQMLSCNPSGYSCNGGFISESDSAYNYLRQPGLVDESSYAYEGQATPCRQLSRTGSEDLFAVGAFRFVTGYDGDSPANVQQIKAAIWKYGSVWAGVRADPAFQAYKGGIFGGNGKGCAAGEPNHAVNIIGWNDAGGYWIIRNSWGSDWGENGFARIAYGCSRIGTTSAYPKDLSLMDCQNGSCQPKGMTPQPWLSGQPNIMPTPDRAPAPAPITPTPINPPQSTEVDYFDPSPQSGQLEPEQVQPEQRSPNSNAPLW
jgi:hypothetical protein